MDPRMNITSKREYAVLKSGSQSTWKQYSTTAISNTSMQFSVPPPSGGVVVDRKTLLAVPVRINLVATSTAAGQTVLRSGFDAPRAYGLSSSIETMQATINNQSVSINLADIIQALLRFNTDEKLKTQDYSVTPTYMDQSQSYASLLGTNRNPLGSYENAGDGEVTPRGGFPFIVVANPVSTGAAQQLTATVDVFFVEYVYLSPFYWGKGMSECGFFNLTAMDFNITFLSQAANRFWSHSSALPGGLPITSSSYFFAGPFGPTSFANNSPFLYFNYITPQETQVLSPNQVITYPYFDVQRYPTDQQPLAAGAQATFISNNIQLNSIPRRMYIYARMRNQDLYSSPENTDTFLSIENVSIQFQNKNGLLSSASKQQLYEMSVSNHCHLSWTEWSGGPVYPSAGNFTPGSQYGTVGSVLCLEFATQVGLDSLDAPGKLSQSQLQVQVLCTNVSSATINPTLYIVTVLEGTFTIEGLGRSSTNIGVISSNDIINCQQSASINYNATQHVNGGNFMSGLSNFGKWLQDTKLISNTLSKIPVAQYFAPLVTAMTGLGEGGVRHRMKYHAGEGEGGGEGAGEGGYGVKGMRKGVHHPSKMRRRAGVLMGAGHCEDIDPDDPYDTTDDWESCQYLSGHPSQQIGGGASHGGATLTRKELAKKIMGTK